MPHAVSRLFGRHKSLAGREMIFLPSGPEEIAPRWREIGATAHRAGLRKFVG